MENTKLKTEWNQKKYKQANYADRKHNTVINRLQIGHTKLKHGYGKATELPICLTYGTRLTIEHIILWQNVTNMEYNREKTIYLINSRTTNRNDKQNNIFKKKINVYKLIYNNNYKN